MALEQGFNPTIKQMSDIKTKITVHRTRDHKQIHYITHATKDVLANFGADPINGQGTWVWQVKEDGSDSGKWYVLKDAWISAG
jgi:hypothetical protein